ncbi:MAG: NAD(P)H-hydrate dehydratase [Vicingaceae bacterium]
MVKIFPVEKIREADQYTIENEPIKSVDLMERAAGRAFEWLEKHFLKTDHTPHFYVFCGIGNNGGDGLVLARLLHEKGVKVSVYLVELSKNYSEDFQTNLNRLPFEVLRLTEKKVDFALADNHLVLDALFGTGLSRKVEGFAAQVIEEINRQSKLTIAIDIPSGLFAEDNSENEAQLIVKAAHTLTFQFPKLSFLFPQNRIFVGEWHIIDIGLSAEYIQRTASIHSYLLLDDAKRMLKPRTKFAHKGTHGRALLLAGSKGKMGAAVLSAKACLRSGLGLLTLQVPEVGYSILQSQVPEAMVEVDNCQTHLTDLKRELAFDALGIGPGIGQAEETQKLLKLLIQECSLPMVIDADALNILSENKTWLSFLPKGSILTPHPGEFKRLVGEWESDFNRHELLRDFAQKFGLFVVLKGANTAVACPDGKVYFNSSGNPGMASGGSGDALTGVLTALLAQGYAPEQAAILGVFVHGLAGDLAANKLGEIGMLPSDLIEALPYAFKLLTD